MDETDDRTPGGPAAIVRQIADGWTVCVDIVEPGIVRVRKFRGEEPPASPLVRYGFVRDDWQAPRLGFEEGEGTHSLTSELLRASVDTSCGALRVGDAHGNVLLREVESPRVGDAPCTAVRFELAPTRRFFGLGDQTRERIEHRGTKGDLWIRNVQSYAPIPFVMTNDGVGLLINSTRRVAYDLGASSDQWFEFAVPAGSLDYYILYGPSLGAILGRYTELTGRPPLPPKWALGLWFICRTQADARELMDDCCTFRREGIPCDAIGLEPGWMATNYDFTVDKTWHPERFPIPHYAWAGRHNFFAAAQRMGFKPGLWLCCDYDLSAEEDRRLHQAAAATGEDQAAFADGHEQDEHLGAARRMDPWTRPGEAWFDHLRKFVDQGVHWFKQDGANQVLNHPDRLWANGMLDDEMHNLYPLLYSKQMAVGFREHTGRRPFGFTVGGWAGVQRHTATWTGDTGGEQGPLGACLNLSLSGHGMSTCDMEVTTREGIHFGFLLPWAQVNSWNYWRHPWYLGGQLKAVFARYARLRYRLLPYLYSCAWLAHTTGMPMLRAMPLEFPDDPETHGLVRQYMLGPSLLVGAFTQKVYLPAGVWYDFWTGQRLGSDGWVSPEVGSECGGPLLVPAGAVVPMGPVVDYVGQRADDEVEVHVYAGAPGALTLYEDDGETFAHEGGACRTTPIAHEPTADGVSVVVGAAQGTFAGAPPRRAVRVAVHGVAEPRRAELNGVAVAAAEADGAPSWRWDATSSTVTVCLGDVPVDRAIELNVAL